MDELARWRGCCRRHQRSDLDKLDPRDMKHGINPQSWEAQIDRLVVDDDSDCKRPMNLGANLRLSLLTHVVVVERLADILLSGIIVAPHWMGPPPQQTGFLASGIWRIGAEVKRDLKGPKAL